jgi:hypothetical protein
MTKSFITINPESYYHEACMKKGFCTATQYLVVDFDKWLNWYSQEMLNTAPPPPLFVGDTYAIALSVADELYKTQTTTEGINA